VLTDGHTDTQTDTHEVKTVYPPVSLRSLGGYKMIFSWLQR